MLLPISILTIVLSFLLISYNWSKNRNVLYLGATFFSLACFGMAHDLLVNIQDPFFLALILNHSTPIYLVAGPMLFFYIRGNLNDDHRIFRKDLFHFLPAILQLIGIIHWIFKPWAEKLAISQLLIQDISQFDQIEFNILFPTEYNLLLRPLHLLVYVLWSAVLLWRFRTQRFQDFHIPDRLLQINHRWMWVLLTSLFLTCIFYLLLAFELLTGNAAVILYRSGILQLLSGSFFFISAGLLLFFPDVLYGLPRVRNIKNTDVSPAAETVQESIPQHSEMDQLTELSNRIRQYMETSRPYTQFEFSINELAEALDVPLNQVSWCLNRVMDVKFTTFRMSYRVEYAKQLLEQGKAREMTIEAVGNLAGFSSRSTFYAAFKEITGLTPTEYLEKVTVDLTDNISA
jgi:AraC-like DNA-binding protein